MYTIKKAEFMLCAAWTSQWPDESLPEVVMAGRSNVGKSSFINTVTNVQGLAKVSSTPGKTRTLNFFNINDELRTKSEELAALACVGILHSILIFHS